MTAIVDLYEMKEATALWRGRASLYGDKRTRKTTRSRELDGFKYDESRRLNLHRAVADLAKSHAEEQCDVYDDFDESEAWAMCSRCGCEGGPQFFALSQFYVSSPRCLACVKHAATCSVVPAVRAQRQTKGKNPFPKVKKSKIKRVAARKSPVCAGENEYRYKYDNLEHSETFLRQRAAFARKFADRILSTTLTITHIRPAPVSKPVAQIFLRLLDHSEDMSMVYHGTRAENLQGIFHRGLLPGGTQGVARLNGASYGVGVYVGRDPLTSMPYCCSKSTMLVCALAERHAGVVRDVGSIVVAHEGTVVPLFMMKFSSANSCSNNTSRNTMALLEECINDPPSRDPARTVVTSPAPAECADTLTTTTTTTTTAPTAPADATLAPAALLPSVAPAFGLECHASTGLTPALDSAKPQHLPEPSQPTPALTIAPALADDHAAASPAPTTRTPASPTTVLLAPLDSVACDTTANEPITPLLPPPASALFAALPAQTVA
jgi:hypothetical protein